tara:strand:- start:836 stop:2677 length:1842 start_codon:yes stop_codon:yes gene_type:complete
MNLTPIVTKNKRTSNALLRDISRRSSLNRMYEKKSLELLKKSIEARSKTYNALSKRDKKGGGLLGNLLGGSLLLRRLRGRGPKGPGSIGPVSGGIRPKLPKGGGTIGGGVSRLGRFGRIGPLAILGTGLDFAGRLGSGQNVAQATIGAGGGLAGALVGGAKGAALGTAIGGPLGTLIGGVGGSILGGFAGGGIADLLTGTSDTRRKKEIKEISDDTQRSKFSYALDRFDNVIDNFEGSTTPLIKDYKENGRQEETKPEFIPQKRGFPYGAVVGSIVSTIAAEIAITAALAFAPIPGSRIVGATRLLSKVPLLMRLARLLRKVAPATSAIRRFTRVRSGAKTLSALKGFRAKRFTTTSSRMSRAFDRGNFPGQSITGRGKLELGRTMSDNRAFRKLDDLLGRKKPSTESLLDLRENAIMRDRLGALGDAQKPDLLVREALRTRSIESVAQQEAVTSMLDFISENFTKQIKHLSPKRFVNRPIVKTINEYANLKSKYMDKKSIDTDKLNELLQRSGDDILKVLEVQMKAEGGRVEAGTPYIVGEVGKELFVPDVSGDIIPNDQLGPAIIAMTSDPDTIIQSSGGGGNSGGGTVIVPASPYDVVAKYAQMTGLFTV